MDFETALVLVVVFGSMGATIYRARKSIKELIKLHYNYICMRSGMKEWMWKGDKDR